MILHVSDVMEKTYHVPSPGVPDDDEEEEDDAVGEARFTSAWRGEGGVLSMKVDVAGSTDEEDESRVEDETEETEAMCGDADNDTEEDRGDLAGDIGTDDADARAVDAADSTMVETDGAAVIVTSCVLTTVVIDTLTDTETVALPAVDPEDAAEVAAEDAGAVDFTEADDAADVAPEETRLELDEEREFAVPEVVVPPPLPPPADVDPGTGVPTMAIGSPLGALGVAVGCTPAKLATGTVPLTVGDGSPPGYESSKMSSCAPSRKLYRFV